MEPIRRTVLVSHDVLHGDTSAVMAAVLAAKPVEEKNEYGTNRKARRAAASDRRREERRHARFMARHGG